MPIIQNIVVYRGENVTLHFTMEPVRDITGWTISFTCARRFNITPKLFQETAVIASGPAGEFDVILTTTDLNLDPGTYVYDVFRTDAGNFRILSVGEFVVKGDARNP